MRFKLYHASQYAYDLPFETPEESEKVPYVDVNTVEDLKKLYEKYKYRLIVDFESGAICIYDGYIE